MFKRIAQFFNYIFVATFEGVFTGIIAVLLTNRIEKVDICSATQQTKRLVEALPGPGMLLIIFSGFFVLFNALLARHKKIPKNAVPLLLTVGFFACLVIGYFISALYGGFWHGGAATGCRPNI